MIEGPERRLQRWCVGVAGQRAQARGPASLPQGGPEGVPKTMAGGEGAGGDAGVSRGREQQLPAQGLPQPKTRNKGQIGRKCPGYGGLIPPG